MESARVAQNDIGDLYANGRGVPQDYAQAMAWYRKAADQGNAVAQYNVGSLYERGQGVPQDIAQALAWYRKAADQDETDAVNAVKRLLERIRIEEEVRRGGARARPALVTWRRGRRSPWRRRPRSPAA